MKRTDGPPVPRRAGLGDYFVNLVDDVGRTALGAVYRANRQRAAPVLDLLMTNQAVGTQEATRQSGAADGARPAARGERRRLT